MGKFYDKGANYILDLTPDPNRAPNGWQPPGSVISTAERNLLIENYWEGRFIKYFPISNQDLIDLLKSSNISGKIMICVENASNSDFVRMKWLPFDKSLMNPVDDYYVIDVKYINGRNGDEEPDGIIYASGELIVATIGRQKDELIVIVNRCKVVLTDDPGMGGPPPGSGLGVPPL
jgi:hypothetical protein